MKRTVLDANVIVSALASPSGRLTELVDAWQKEQIKVILSDHVLHEVRVAWGKRYWRNRYLPEEIERYLQFIQRNSEIVVPTPGVSGVAAHEEDDVVIATALSGNADYLVTGDKELLRLKSYKTVSIVSPQEFLEILGADDDS